MLKTIKLPPRLTLRRLKCWLRRNTDIPEKDIPSMARYLMFQLTTDGSNESFKAFFNIL